MFNTRRRIKMKRFISVILLITLISAMFNVSLAAEAGKNTAERLVISAAAEKGTPGGELKVTLSLDENPGFMYLRITPKFNTEILTLKSVTKEGAEVVYDGLAFSRNIVIDHSTDITGTGKLATLTFAVAAGIAVETTDIEFEIKECYNKRGDIGPDGKDMNNGNRSNYCTNKVVEIDDFNKCVAAKSTICCTSPNDYSTPNYAYSYVYNENQAIGNASHKSCGKYFDKSATVTPSGSWMYALVVAGGLPSSGVYEN